MFQLLEEKNLAVLKRSRNRAIQAWKKQSEQEKWHVVYLRQVELVIKSSFILLLRGCGKLLVWDLLSVFSVDKQTEGGQQL